MKHNVGFIGFGVMGSRYHYELARDRADVCDGLSPLAVYDVRKSQQQFAAENNLKVCATVEELLAIEEIDIIVVACANNFHCEMTCKALEAGKHVICEKPAAMSPEEFDIMVETSKRTGKLLFIHQNRRVDCDFLTVKHAYETGRLGKLSTIESSFCGGEMFGWRSFKDHAGGSLYDWGVHLIDQIVYLMDEPVKSVYADLKCEKNPEVDDRSVIEFTFESGAKGRVTVCGSFLAPLPRFAVYGDKGVMWIKNIYDNKGTLRYAKEAHWESKITDAYNAQGAYDREEVHLIEDIEEVSYPDDGASFKQDWADLYKSMIRTIEGKEEMLVKHEQVRTVLRIIEAAFKSSETGEVIKL